MIQQTLESTFEIQGIGLHSGRKVRMVLRGACEDSGIVFCRVDLPRKPEIRAHISHVLRADRCTTVGNQDACVSTVEHLLAAAYCLGVHNLIIEIDGEEVPAMDGSAIPLAEKILEAGIRRQRKKIQRLLIESPRFSVTDGASLIALPYPRLRITYVTDFKHLVVPPQILDVTLNRKTFIREIAPARTFGFLEEVQSLWERRLALGGDLENALLIGPKGYSSPLRFPDEVVRHKCLDLLGDLALLGMSLQGHLIAVKSGHSLNIEFLRKINYKEVADAQCQGDTGNPAPQIPLFAGG